MSIKQKARGTAFPGPDPLFPATRHDACHLVIKWTPSADAAGTGRGVMSRDLGMLSLWSCIALRIKQIVPYPARMSIR
jgi:hypothetical protein